MKSLIAVALPLLAVAGSAPAPVIVHPLGAVYAAPPSTRPLGGIASGRRHVGTRTAPGYIGPVYYTPNYFDSYTDLSNYPPPPPPPVQPVIINQYFGTKGSAVPDAVNTAEAEPPVQETASPGDPLEPPQNYYLIRYKDRSTFSALAYWVEGDTLHYVTTDNKHNQASLDLIDIDQTYKLNADRSVPFAIPGR